MRYVITESQSSLLRRYKILYRLDSSYLCCEEEYNNNDDLNYYLGRLYGVDNNQ